MPSTGGGARQRTATPTVPVARRRPAAQQSDSQPVVPRQEAPGLGARPPPSAAKTPAGKSRWRMLLLPPLRLSFLVTLLGFAAFLFKDGARLLVQGLADDSRAQRIAVFREFLRRSSAPAVPLPLHLRGQPPPLQLRAAWTPGSTATERLDFHLDLLEVPLTIAVLGDHQDPDDEVQLPVADGNETQPDGGAELEDLSQASRRSVLYRAAIPAKTFWASHGASAGAVDVEDSPPGRLEVWLPDGRPLLQHVFQPVRWLSAKSGEKPLQAAECEAAGGALDPLQGWCSEPHGVARLCYALPPEGGPYDGTVVPDCEHGHRSPVYLPLRGRNGQRGERVEVVLRGRMDAYVLASETTQGCSNCLGRPYGSGAATGAELFACGGGAWGLPAGNGCFGSPPRLAQASGLAHLGFACVALGLSAAFFGGRCVFYVAGPAAAVAGALLPVAAAVRQGLPGMLRRTTRSMPMLVDRPLLASAVTGLGVLAPAAIGLLPLGIAWVFCSRRKTSTR